MANPRLSSFMLCWLLICVILIKLVPATDDCDMYSALVYRTERYCFAFMKWPRRWEIIEKRCRYIGALLAKMDEHIMTEATASAIANAFKIGKSAPVHVYVGFDRRPGNAPVWLLDGSNVTIPDVDWNAKGYGVLSIDHRGDSVNYTWTLSRGISKLPYICQFDLHPLKVRLVNGPNPRAGRVEVYYFYAWGTVCDYDWDNHDAQVVCRMLGFPTDRAVAHKYAFFGEGTGPIFLEDVKCRGNETSLRQCTHRGWGVTSCRHSREAGVVCPAPGTDDCDVYSTLVYRTDRYCFGFVNQSVSWQTAEKRCALLGARLAKMDEHIVTNITASAIANAFKIRKDVPVHVYVGFYNRSGNAPVWLLDGTNVTLPDVYWGTEGDGVLSIDHHGDSVNYTWILSPGISELPYICQFDLHPLKVRLVNGPNPRAGRVEVYYFNAWRTVCDTLNLFDYRDAQVVCRMLGFPTDRANALHDAFFGEGTGPIFESMLVCLGEETSLRQCSRRFGEAAGCKHSGDVGVVCPVPDTDDCDVYSTLVYRTERYCFAFMNQSVSWEAAKKRCTTLGAVLAKMDEHIMTDATASTIANAFKIPNDERAHVHVGFYKRPANASVWLLDGSKVTISDEDWETEGRGVLSLDHHGDDVNYTWTLSPGTSELPYICQFDLHPLKVRLVNGPNPRAGRVEVYYFSAWRTVCDTVNSFDYRDAQVVCRMLGFPTDRAMAIKDAFFGEGTGPIFLDSLECRGDEMSLQQCSRGGDAAASCEHSGDAGVVCPAPVTDDCDMYSSLVYRTERYCFAFMTRPDSWERAEFRCRTFGGVLAKMDEHVLTDSTVSAIADAFKIRKDVDTHIHVGFYKRSGNAVWLLDGSKVTFPGVDWGTDGDGMLFIGHRGDSLQYMLLVYPNYDLRPYICQFDLQPLKVRLVNGPNPRAGRLEVYYFDAWGTVCDGSSGNLYAEVVCRMLGFPSDRAVGYQWAFFGKGTGPIHLNNVRCRGNEANLRHCSHIGPYMTDKITETCGHYMDASVVCPGLLQRLRHGATQVGATHLGRREAMRSDPSDGTMPDILGGTATAESVGETTDVTVYGTTAVSIYVISDTPLISTTTSSDDEDNVDTTGDDSRAGTTRRTKLARRTRTRRQKKPARISKVVAMTMESVYMNGQALIEKRSAMVTMCSRLCSSDDRCARFNYNKVTGACRIFSKDAEVSYKTKPDWTVWEAIVIPQ